MRLDSRARKRAELREQAAAVRRGLGDKSLVLIGLMGAGKSAIGRRLATRLELPFVDADTEIEAAAGQSIKDIFAVHGESYFREGERKVIHRLLHDGPQVLATGGGAYMDAKTRATVGERGISIWLEAQLDVLLERVRRRSNRPLLRGQDPEEVMRRLMEERYPVYAQADITVHSRDVPHQVIVGEILAALINCPPVVQPADDDSRRQSDNGS